MLVTPTLMQVKTRPVRDQQEHAFLLRSIAPATLDMPDGLKASDVLARLDAAVLRHGPEETEWNCIRGDHAAMATAGEWSDLLEALRFTDQERSMASGGQRVAYLISEGMRSALSHAIASGDWLAAKAEIGKFEDLFERNSNDYCAAQVLAQAHIDLADGRRDQLAQGQLSREIWAEGVARYARAEELMTTFDPIEEMSPLLAGTRYAMVRGIEEGSAVCREWYDDWCDLDPEDANVHARHAANMLPGWFGSLSAFEREARRAVRMTEMVTGKAAYAVFHLTAARELGELAPTVDHELLFEALADFQAASGCQRRANIAAALLAGLTMDFRKAGPSAIYQLTKARAALSGTIWNHLREIQTECWTDRADGLAYALAEVFGPALKRGARIVRRGDGLGTLVRRS